MRKVRPNLLIAVDHEGGRVQRFRDGFTRLPPPASHARDRADEDSSFLESAVWLMAAELRAVDIDFSFAPALDDDAGISQIIGDRFFSTDAAASGDCAAAMRVR